MWFRGKGEGKSLCIECEQKHLQQLANDRLVEESRKRNLVWKITDEHPELKAKIMQRLGIKDLAAGYFVQDHDFQDICDWGHIVSQAKNYETARRYEDSAKMYESLGLWKEAGTVRDKKSARTVKHVTVNINDLIEKVRDGGLTIPYKCHSCGATITIDSHSNPDGLKFCSYCGSAVDPDSMLDIIKSALK